MKVKQVVGEHKKGFRAKKYASKPKKYIEPVKPTNTATKPQSVAEGSLTEMDKSSPQPGRDGKVSHKTYGSRDNYKLGDPERMAKQVSAEKAKKDALNILKKQGVAEGDDPLQNRADYAKKHGQGQVYKKTYPGDKVGMTKTYAYDVKRTGPKGQLPKEDLELEENNPIGVVSNVTPDGKQVTIKKTDGTELKTTGDAVLPGPDGKTASLAPGAGNELKPGTPVTSGQTLETSEESLGTMPTTEYVKGIYAAAAENGMDAPEVEAVKKQMVLAPNGEVDIMKTMQKALQVFQSPEWKQMLADLDALVKKAEAGTAPMESSESSRLKELAGIKESNIQNLGNGAQKRTHPDGTYEIGDGSGVRLFSADGKLLKYVSPTFGGFNQETDQVTGNVTQNYNAGPMSASQTRDKAGNLIKSKATYNLGTGVVGHEQEKGITSKSWKPASADLDPVSHKDLYAMGSKDKEATYDRAMRQVQQTNESSELDAMLRIAGLK